MAQPHSQSLPLLELWLQALHEPVGIVVETTNRTTLMNRLYEARKEYQDREALMGLSICVSPMSENELWIIHQTVRVKEPPK
jgi:hypothetical protein